MLFSITLLTVTILLTGQHHTSYRLSKKHEVLSLEVLKFSLFQGSVLHLTKSRFYPGCTCAPVVVHMQV